MMWPRITQLAWIVVNREGSTLEHKEFRMDEGADIIVALNVFAATLKGCDCVVAHNIDFHANMVRAECMRAKMDIKWNGARQLCSMRSSTLWCAIPHSVYTYKWPSLSELHFKLFGSWLEGDGTAREEAEAVTRCLVEMLRRRIVK